MNHHTSHTPMRARWAAIGAAVAVTLGAGGIGVSNAMIDSGERAVYVPIEPCRMLDTRPQFPPNDVTDKLGANKAMTFDLDEMNGNCSAIADATGLALNVTPVGPSAATYLSFVPGMMTPPASGVYDDTSNLNPTPGEPPTPNAVEVNLDVEQRFSVYNAYGSVDVVIDIVGYFEDHNHDDLYHRKEDVYTKDDVYTKADVYTQNETNMALDMKAGLPAYGEFCSAATITASEDTDIDPQSECDPGGIIVNYPYKYSNPYGDGSIIVHRTDTGQYQVAFNGVPYNDGFASAHSKDPDVTCVVTKWGPGGVLNLTDPLPGTIYVRCVDNQSGALTNTTFTTKWTPAG